jgi:succinate dehydrogenase/fumarate reductase flavoprotein subunit
MGGLACDENGETDLPGLFAVGECSCISVHGANRLGGNSLLETVVFGKRVGARAADLVRGGTGSVPDATMAEALREQRAAIDALKARPVGERQGVIRRHMKVIMTEKVGVYREEKPLAEAVEALAELKGRYRNTILDNKAEAFNYDLVDTLELGGMLELAEVTAITALKRPECRGSHWRTDRPGRNDEEWLRHSMATFNPDGPPHVAYKEALITTYRPTERKY